MTYRLAHIMDRETERLSRIGTRASNASALRIRVGILHAFRYGWDPLRVLRSEMLNISALVHDAMVAAHLTGLRRSALNATHYAGRLVLASPYDSAMRFLEDRLDLSDYQRRALADKYGKNAISATGKLTGKLERQVESVVKEAIRKGLPTKKAVNFIRGEFDRLGISLDKPSSIETLFRTQTQIAYSAGRWQANKDPAIDEILWGYKYVTVGDDRVRPTHAALEGTQLPKDDLRWLEIWPPNGYNCRCQTIEVFDDGEVIDFPDTVEIDGVDVKPGPDKGFDFNAGVVLPEAA